MGKYTLLLTFSVALALAYFAQQSMQMSAAANKDQVQRQKTVIARQIARSAFDKGASEVKRSWPTAPSDELERTYEQGEYRLEFSSSSTGGDKEISITSTGIYPPDPPDEVKYRIEGAAEERTVVSGLFSGITANDAIRFSGSSGKGCSGLACISGKTDNGEDRPGMNLPASMELDENGCPKTSKGSWDQEDIEGGDESRVNECSVQSRGENASSWIDKKMEEIKDEINKNGSNVKVCNGGCHLKGKKENKNKGKKNKGGKRSGILYVPAGERVKFSGTSSWNGLVYVEKGGDVVIKGGGGRGSGGGGGNNRNINGGLLMEGHKMEDGKISDYSDFKMSGGNRVQYNPDKIEKYVNIKSYNGGFTEVVVTDRKSCIVSDMSERCP